MDQIHYRLTNMTSEKDIMKMNKPVYLQITAAFLIFLSLVIGTHRFNTDGGTTVPLFLTGAFTAVLLGVVLQTVFRSAQQMEKMLASLQSQLTRENQASRDLQLQFEEAIEKRTIELQMVNGSLNREIAERIQAEEEVRELEKKLKLILDSAGEGILGLDHRGEVTFINRAASLMLGWEADELLGHTHHDLIHHTNPDGSPHPVENCPIYMAYRDGKVHYKTGDIFWCKNGSSFPVEYVSTPIRDRGMLTGAVVVFRDMNTYK